MAKKSVTLTITHRLHEEVMAHLFPGDGEEHGLIILAGLASHEGGIRLLAKEVLVAQDGIDYVQGRNSHRSLRAEFIRVAIKRCREERLVYLAAHNHGGSDRVAFSDIDLESHEKGYPTLLDLSEGMPVGALVYAKRAVAGDIWLSTGKRMPLDKVTVLSRNITRLFDKPRKGAKHAVPETFDRQVRMFGADGQMLLQESTVGVIGAGGVGSLVIEQFARLGVGRLIVADPDRIDTTNLSRVVGATHWDARDSTFHRLMPAALRRMLKKRAETKCRIAHRNAKRANPRITFVPIDGDFSKDDVARKFLECDYLVLAADTMKARLVFNAIVHQYLIPGIQIGSKIVSTESGRLEDAFSVSRWISPGTNCLWCSGLISRHQLAVEAKSDSERHDQAYGTESPSPSVITLNAIGAAYACNDMLFSLLGLNEDSSPVTNYRFKHGERRVIEEQAWINDGCSECGKAPMSRFARGDATPLPTDG